MTFPRRAAATAAFFLAAAAPASAQSLSAEGWTVTLGGTVTAQPLWLGSSRLGPFFSPRFSLRSPGSPVRFSSFDDGISPALLDVGYFRLGPTISFVNARRARDDARLIGLRDVPFTVEAGLFAEFYPVEWLRLRATARYGFAGHHGLTGDVGADAIWRPDDRWTLAAGPRLAWGNDRFAARYFSVSAAQSLASGLPTFAASGGVVGVGAAGSVSYRFDGGWTATGFAAYERLTGSAASAPLVALRGSRDQFTVGTSLTYSFTIGR